MSASWFLVSMYLIWILGSRIIRSNNQSSATLWVLETCLIVGLLPLMIILISASLSSNTYNKASWCEDWTFEGTQSILFSALIFPWDLWLLSMIIGRPGLSEVGIVSVQRDDFGFCTTVWNGNLFLTHPTCWNKCTTSENAQCVPPEVDFESSRSPAKSRVWKQSQSALFCSVTHLTILFVFTFVMNMWNQSIQAFVTGLGPFCDGSCKFVHWP